ncbi:RNA dependent RNA polymerase [Plasmopara viticola lesion associated ourmia-like virus 35]|uniref:RNA dependent RNA polymerase n=1 Tax=Plasmopara viticola lesion associated ourmia-like virus 35 TaxID=2686504 RepID=A0ABX6FKX5_9VIRU|nr:RNA dependent RNA polymerase [Plasmopara viticola lesion associated ourmia-like virus 35]QGY72565.1 RNA dependent RNA polymerase [Plasmopara viticola lesion associated ourmia-like virus 35]
MTKSLSLPRRAPARSRNPCVKGDPSDKSARGSEVKRCVECRKATRDTKQVIHNGLQLIRIRYGVPYSELPDCSPEDLTRLLSFLLLQGKERPPVAFPRAQRGKSIDGLCQLQRLGRRSRWTLAHSMSSIKRNLPAGCRHHTPSKQKDWESSACSQPPPHSPEYLRFVRSEVTRIFSSGWDKDYERFVTSHVPNPTGRKPKSSRADEIWSGRREEFLTACLSDSAELPSVLTARYKEVFSAGKKRPLLIFDEWIELLAPLHKKVYNHLCKQDWLLCGPPTEERMTSVCVNRVQTSVDLVNATDGLYHSVAETILDALFFTAWKIPRPLRRLAKASLSPIFESRPGVHRRVRHGQMMGAYLSFPLLCLQSYVAARWASRFDCEARYLVNGDDTVISASRGVSVQDYPPGMRLNADKTITAESVVEVNSTAFLRTRGGWREVRHLRRGGALTDYPGMMHIASAVIKAGKEWVDAYQRARIGRRWGFLPSQLGHWSYASYLRERQMLRSRIPTILPAVRSEQNEALLRKVPGEPSLREQEALRAFIWTHGRSGGLKRDEFSPSCGKIRRTYRYAAQPPRSYLSYIVKMGMVRHESRRKTVGFYYLPEDDDTDEEKRAYECLALWREPFVRGSS